MILRVSKFWVVFCICICGYYVCTYCPQEPCLLRKERANKAATTHFLNEKDNKTVQPNLIKESYQILVIGKDKFSDSESGTSHKKAQRSCLVRLPWNGLALVSTWTQLRLGASEKHIGVTCVTCNVGIKAPPFLRPWQKWPVGSSSWFSILHFECASY